jgi:hypothetical protein
LRPILRRILTVPQGTFALASAAGSPPLPQFILPPAACGRLFLWSIHRAAIVFRRGLVAHVPVGDQKIPGLRAGIVAAAPLVFAKYGITTPLLVAHVMAQISHECGAGHDVVENLNYSAGPPLGVGSVSCSTVFTNVYRGGLSYFMTAVFQRLDPD